MLPTELERVLQASIARRQWTDRGKRRAESPSFQWIAQGGSANVHGYATGDFVYIGNGAGTEPSAIDPRLPIDAAYPNTSGEQMPYWPAYDSIPAECRAAYLQWLHGGRTDPYVAIGYVFVFFYGLERRVYDFIARRGSNADEVLAIANEVARLYALHANRSGSFERYAEELLDLIELIEPRARTIPREITIQPGYGVPRRIAIALGELAVAEQPVPAGLALDWLRSIWYFNMPAIRCADEFELLFHIRYAKRFGQGLYLQPGRTFLDFTYQPASAALDAIRVNQRDIPDVTQLARPRTKLTELTQECSSALDAFSRLLGKNPSARESLAAFALLPDELIEGTHSADAKSLAALVTSRLDEHGRAQLGAAELLQFVRIAKPEKIAKNEAMLLAQALEKLGYGIEPDVRLGGPTFESDGRVIVFRRLPDCPSTASDEYATATICMRLGTMVSAADDDVSEQERALLERHIAEALLLSAGERQRLRAHLAWLIETNPGTAGMKKRLAALSHDARHHIGRLLVSIATTDTRVDPREMKILEKLYDLIGLNETDLYRDVHSAQSADDEPLVIDTPASVSKRFTIPPKPQPTPGLDMSRVRLRIAETRQVSALLGSIFVEDEAPARIAPIAAQANTIGTLDAAHSELLRRLAQCESWTRDEVERITLELSLMTDGALEAINDYAYATADEPFWEDDDPIAINAAVARNFIR
ncbi:MAG TPA: TerB N-terminal domain-containing protein [Thermoanaerobaculia bacterium]|jgi:uncharacterized tellurite resistance protein B-like protein|nr:TerB N-terminal domain-containing protein [Thermoanaerobaculia bacterium]